MNLSEKFVGDVTVLVLDGKLVLGDGEHTLKDRVNALLRQGRKYLVLNMKGVSYLDSYGVGVLAWKFVTTRKQGGTIKLASLSPRSHSPLYISKLLEVFEVFGTEDEAVRSLDAARAKTGSLTIPPR